MDRKPLKIGDLTARIPVIQGGMGVGISLSHLAGSVAANGGVGILSAAQIGFREPDFEEHPKEAAGIMKITAKDLKELGVIEWIVPEVEPAQKKNLETIAGNMKEHMLCFLEKQEEKSEDQLAIERYERFRRY